MRDTRRNKRNEDERRAGQARKGNRERDEARVSRAEKNAKRNGLSQKFPAGPILNTGWRYYAPRSRRKIASCLANSSRFPCRRSRGDQKQKFLGSEDLRRLIAFSHCFSPLQQIEHWHLTSSCSHSKCSVQSMVSILIAPSFLYYFIYLLCDSFWMEVLEFKASCLD